MATLTFLILGDWGGQEAAPYTTDVETANAAAMGKVAQLTSASMVLAVGDNFYSYGVKNEDDVRFQKTFDSEFTAPSLQVPWYVIAGNHDHRGNVSAQIAYSDDSDRWNFPSLYYTFSKTFDNGHVADFFMLDTVVLAGMGYMDAHTNKSVSPPGASDPVARDAQLTWLEEGLSKSSATYVFVVGHYPVWSGCSHGPTALLVSQLKPLLEKYYVTAYISGHDHCLEHIDTGAGPSYVLSGAGMECCYDLDHADKCPENSIKFYLASDNSQGLGGFATVAVSASAATVKYLDTSGTTLYESALRPPRRK